MTVPAADSHYDLQSIRLPYLAGAKLRLAVALLDSPLRHLLMPRLLRDAGITWLRSQIFDEPPTSAPRLYGGAPWSTEAAVPMDDWPLARAERAPGFSFATIHDYARAYRENLTSPAEVAGRLLQAVAASNESTPPLRAVIACQREDVLRQAEAATKRLRAGKPLGVFDGVPVGVKDELQMIPYPTTAGTAFFGQHSSTIDATVVARLRAAGALLIGKMNMNEIGLGVTGLNPHLGTPRNPYAIGRHTGGSSSGPAAAVAAGLCPLAIGADGGGSIRIPAALCGIVGLKPTYGRVSTYGSVPLCWTLGHVGPMAATATDAALGYAAIAGPDPKDSISLHQPPPVLNGWNQTDLRGVKLGVFRPWFRDADDEVVAICEAMLERLRERGAEVREVLLPELEAARIAHAVTICGEMAQATHATYAQSHRRYGRDVRISLRIARAISAFDYVQAQRVRTRLIAHLQKAFAEVDAIITPATGMAAPSIPETALDIGVSDLATLSGLMRYATPANLSGFPAISFPAGYTAGGLPVGLQAMGRPWEEPLLLRLALVAESCVERKAPERHFRVLSASA